MHEAASSSLSSPLVLVYLGMGLMTARILLEGQKLRAITWLQWLQLFVRAGSIILLWPLVLFIEKFEHWVRAPGTGNARDDTQH